MAAHKVLTQPPILLDFKNASTSYCMYLVGHEQNLDLRGEVILRAQTWYPPKNKILLEIMYLPMLTRNEFHILSVFEIILLNGPI